MEKALPEQMSGGENDFESLMEQSLKAPRPGDVLVGRVLLITRDSVIIDINYKCEGQVPLAEFLDHEGHPTVKEGDEVDVYFEGTETENGTVMLSHAKAEKFKVWRELDKAFQTETPVEGVVLGKVKGGLKVDIGVPAFLPGSHVDIRPARNLDRYVGQRGRFQILKFNRARGNVVVSRRSVLERERASLKEQTLKVLEEGVILEGTVKNITDYGAFIDLGGIDGLLHITDMAWGRLQHPSEVLEGRRQGQGRRAQVRPRARARLAGDEADHARPVDQGGRSVSAGHANQGQGRQRHRLRRVRRDRKGRRGSDPRLRDELEQARGSSVQGRQSRRHGRSAGARG